MSTILIFDQAEYPGGSIARAVDMAITMPNRNFIIVTYHPLNKLYGRPLTKNIKAIRLYSFYNFKKKFKHTRQLMKLVKNKILYKIGLKLIALIDWFNETSLSLQVAIKLLNKSIDLVQANAGIHFLPYRVALLKKSALIYYFRHIDDYRWASRVMINRASHYIFVGKNLMARHRSIIEYPEHKCQVIYSPFNTQKRLDETEPTDIAFLDSLKENQNFIILMAARICYDKGQEIAIEAIKKLNEKYPNITLILAGDEDVSYAQKLRPKIKEFRLNNNVIFIGQRNDIPHLLKRVDLALQAPLCFEAIGGSLVEAMQLGTLTVSSDIGGTSEVIKQGKNGFLFPPGDSNKLAEIIENIIENRVDKDALRKAGKEHANRLWCPEKIHRAMSLVYSEAIEYRQKSN